MNQELTQLKDKVDISTIIVGDFNTPLTIMNRTTKMTYNKSAGLKRHTQKTLPNDNRIYILLVHMRHFPGQTLGHQLSLNIF